MKNLGSISLKSTLSAFVASVALLSVVTPAAAQEWRARNSAQEATAAAERAARNARAQTPGYRGQYRGEYRQQQNRPQYRSNDQYRARNSAYNARVAAERAEQRARNGGYRTPTYRTPSSGYYQSSREQEWRARESARSASRAARNAGDRAYYENRRIENRWNGNWRNDRRYNYNVYRNQYRNIYRMPTYYSPYRDRGYSRLSIGINLGSGYYGSRYWINNPYQYRLPPAPYGARWVRYYNDVVLVDTRSGYVLDVIRNFFW